MNKTPADSTNNTDLIFAPEDDDSTNSSLHENPWKILIIDDEPDIHEVTQMSLANFNFAGCGLAFLNAYSDDETRETLQKKRDMEKALATTILKYFHAFFYHATRLGWQWTRPEHCLQSGYRHTQRHYCRRKFARHWNSVYYTHTC